MQERSGLDNHQIPNNGSFEDWGQQILSQTTGSGKYYHRPQISSQTAGSGKKEKIPSCNFCAKEQHFSELDLDTVTQ